MKKFIKYSLLFIVVSSISYIGFVGIFGNLLEENFNSNLIYEPTTGYNDVRLKEVEKINDIDVLFIGSSHSYRSFDPRILKQYGLKTFNLGSSSQSHVQTNYLLKKYLDRLNPDLVVYEVFPHVFSSNGVESSINLVSSSPEINWDLFSMAIKSKNLLIINNFIYSTFLNIRNFDPRVEKHNEKDRYIRGGYVQRIVDTVNKEKNTLSTFWSSNSRQINYFKKNIEIIKRNSKTLILVQTPYTYEYSNQSKIDSFFEKYEDYYDLNKMMNLSDSLDFFDPHHVNQNGAEKVSQFLAPLLLKKLKKKSKK